jgi:non-heme chloroperoxidase
MVAEERGRGGAGRQQREQLPVAKNSIGVAGGPFWVWRTRFWQPETQPGIQAIRHFPVYRYNRQDSPNPNQGDPFMPTITTKDGTQIYYKDWGAGQPVVFSHGWPLSADAWEDQMVFLGTHGYRVIAHDRRGHGRSSQPWDGNNMDTYADDLAALTEALDLKSAVHVGHSAGGGEVARYIGRHGTKRVAKAVLIGAVPPLMLQTEANPGGLPLKVFDGIRAGVLADRSQFFKDLTATFYGANRPGSTVSQGLRDSFWLQGMASGFKAVLDCIKAFSETDFTEDLKKIDVPTLVMHGDDDQIVPINDSALLSVALVKGATLKVYPGAPHGLCSTHKNQVNADLLEFIQR